MLTVEKLELIFNEFPMPALVLTPTDDLKIVKVNDAFLNIIGTDAQQVNGKRLFEIFPDEECDNPDSDIKRTDRTIHEVLATRKANTPGTIAYHLPDPHTGLKKLRFFVPEFFPVINERGSISYIFHYTHEVTGPMSNDGEQMSLMSSFERILNTSQNAFLLTTGDGNVVLANEAACTLFGYTMAEFSKIERHDVLDYSDERLFTLLINREKTGSAKGEITAIKKNGERFPCEYSSSRFIDINGEKRCCTEFVDLTRWKAEQDRTMQSEKNLQAIFNSTIEGFLLLDRELRIVAFNEKVSEFFFLIAKVAYLRVGIPLLEYLEENRKVSFSEVATRALSGQHVAYERSYQDQDGQIHWFAFSVNPVREGATVSGLCISGRDITQHKQIEERLMHSERRFRGLVEHNLEAIAILSVGGKVLYVSPAGEKITGFTCEEVKQIDVFKTIHEGDRIAALRVVADVGAQPGIPVKASPLRMRHKDGCWHWIEAIITNMLHDPAIGGTIYNFRDVTEQIEAQELLLKAKQEAELSEEKYRKIFNQSPLPKWIYDLKTLRFLEVNEEAIRHYGYSREEYLAMTVLDLRPKEDIESVKAAIQQIATHGSRQMGNWRHLKKNGEMMIAEVTGHRIRYQNRDALMVICRDVTGKLQAEAALMQSSERFRQASRATSDAIWDWDIATNTVFLGEGYATLFGFTEAGSTVPRSWFGLRVHPEDRSEVLRRIERVIDKGNGDRWQHEYRFKKADGSWAIVCNKAVTIRDEQQNPVRMIGAMQDVTAQKAEEHHLRLLQSVITNTTDAVMITGVEYDRRGPEVIFVNPAFVKMTGYSLEEVQREGINLLHGPDTDTREILKLNKAIQNRESARIVNTFYKKNGEKYWASLAISPVKNAQGEVKNYIGIERDVSDRMNYVKAIEAQNMQLREIAWYQSHMVRAPLARILGLIHLMTMNSNGAEINELLPMLETSAEELDGIVHDIVRKTYCVYKDLSATTESGTSLES